MKMTGKKIVGIIGWVLLGGVAGAVAQDVMQQRLPFLKVVAEDDKVRVLRYAPAAGDKSAIAVSANRPMIRSISRVPRCQERYSNRRRRGSRPSLERVLPVTTAPNAKSPDGAGRAFI